MARKKLSEEKSKDEKQWMIESAVRTLQEMGQISNDPELLSAAQKELDKQMQEAEATKKMVQSMSSKTPLMQTKEV